MRTGDLPDRLLHNVTAYDAGRSHGVFRYKYSPLLERMTVGDREFDIYRSGSGIGAYVGWCDDLAV